MVLTTVTGLRLRVLKGRRCCSEGSTSTPRRLGVCPKIGMKPIKKCHAERSRSMNSYYLVDPSTPLRMTIYLIKKKKQSSDRPLDSSHWHIPPEFLVSHHKCFHRLQVFHNEPFALRLPDILITWFSPFFGLVNAKHLCRSPRSACSFSARHSLRNSPN